MLVDTVWVPHRFEFVENLKKEIDLHKIDYIIANHGECDHSGSLTALMDEIPDTPIYCTAAAVKSLRHYFGDEKLTVLSGVLKDKDYFAIAKDLATVGAEAFTFTPMNPRALGAEDYAKVLNDTGIFATACASLKDAYKAAFASAKKAKRPLVCLGSLYTYKDLMEYIENT